jgi:hypothetical protein
MSTTTRRRGKQADEPRPMLRFNGVGNGVDLLVPDAASNVPASVKQASDEAEAAHRRWMELRPAFFHAETEVKRAPRLDAAADAAASAAGQPLPEQRLTTAAQAALEASERAMRAAHENYHEAQRVLASEIAAALPAWLPTQHEAVEQARTEITDALTMLVQSFERLEVESRILVGLESFPAQGGNLRGVTFGVSERDREYADDKRRRVTEQERASISLPGHGAALVPRERDHLIAALALLAEDSGQPRLVERAS